MTSNNLSNPLIGSWIQLYQPAIAEILANAGFDWLAIDLEHSVTSLREAEEMIRIIDLHRSIPLVRTSGKDPTQIARIMDAGAHGVIVPMVNNETDARLVTDSVFYPPHGKRGVGLARAHKYGASFEEYRKWLSENALVIVQIESVEAVENLRSIFSVKGVNGFMVGPYDLSSSLGIPGQLEHPKMISTMNEINAIADEFPNILKGIHKISIDSEPTVEAARNGYQLIAYATDMHFLGDSCRKGLKEVRAKLKNV